MDGLLVIDKSAGMTSRDAVNAVQRWLPRRTKIGHTGTLDPLATGVLVLCIGSATKLAERIQAMGKSYTTRVRLGAASDTDDVEGVVVETPNASPPNVDAIRELLPRFRGEIVQMPPQFSALKVDGQRAHKLARQGLTVDLKPRTVRVDRLEIQHYEWPHLDLAIDCGKGTYIRSIARDLGQLLSVGGLVQTLRRTRVGPFRVEDGVTLDQPPASVLSRMLPSSIEEISAD